MRLIPLQITSAHGSQNRIKHAKEDGAGWGIIHEGGWGLCGLTRSRAGSPGGTGGKGREGSRVSKMASRYLLRQGCALPPDTYVHLHKEVKENEEKGILYNVSRCRCFDAWRKISACLYLL
jgi:hypothetical protein